MNRYVILSVNSDPQYLYYIRLARWAWYRIGWIPVIMYRGEYHSDIALLATNNFDGLYVDIKPIPGYRDDTVTQVSRLYAGHLKHIEPNDLIMTGDVDLIPLSDHWQPDPEKITLYGHDLADYKHYPICYIAMAKSKWIQVMGLSGESIKASIKRDLDTMPQAKDPDFYKYWFTDQDLITQRINATQFERVMVDRGKYRNGLAVGRVDRGIWSIDLDKFIDAHLHRDLYKAFHNPYHPDYRLFQKKWVEHFTMLNLLFPQEDWSEFTNYTKAFAAYTESPSGIITR